MDGKENDPRDLYELKQAAQELNIGIATLFRWMKSGKIVSVPIYRRTFIPKSEIDRINGKATVEQP